MNPQHRHRFQQPGNTKRTRICRFKTKVSHNRSYHTFRVCIITAEKHRHPILTEPSVPKMLRSQGVETFNNPGVGDPARNLFGGRRGMTDEEPSPKFFGTSHENRVHRVYQHFP